MRKSVRPEKLFGPVSSLQSRLRRILFRPFRSRTDAVREGDGRIRRRAQPRSRSPLRRAKRRTSCRMERHLENGRKVARVKIRIDARGPEPVWLCVPDTLPPISKLDPASGTRAQWLVLTAAFLGWLFDGLEMGIFPLVARPALQTMIPSASMALAPDQFVGTWMGRITALFLVGAACGGLVFGWLGDRMGRVRAMTLSILTYSIFTGLCFFAQQPWHLGTLRFVAAFGMGGEWSLGVALVMESWPRDKRPLLAGIIGAAANVGFALIAVLGLYWRGAQKFLARGVLAGGGPRRGDFFFSNVCAGVRLVVEVCH